MGSCSNRTWKQFLAGGMGEGVWAGWLRQGWNEEGLGCKQFRCPWSIPGPKEVKSFEPNVSKSSAMSQWKTSQGIHTYRVLESWHIVFYTRRPRFIIPCYIHSYSLETKDHHSWNLGPGARGQGPGARGSSTSDTQCLLETVPSFKAKINKWIKKKKKEQNYQSQGWSHDLVTCYSSPGLDSDSQHPQAAQNHSSTTVTTAPGYLVHSGFLRHLYMCDSHKTHPGSHAIHISCILGCALSS